MNRHARETYIWDPLGRKWQRRLLTALPSRDAMQDTFGSGTGITHDVMFRGALQLTQSRRGYRFGIDSVLLAARAASRQPERFLEIGAGCGIISLAIDYLLEGRATGTCIEVQPSLFERLEHNLHLNDAHERVQPVLGDARTLGPSLRRQRADVVVMNPPYFEFGHGQTNPSSERARARHQLDGTLRELLHAGRQALAPTGSMELVYPASRLATLLADLSAEGLRHVDLRMIHPFATSPAEVVLASARFRRRDEVTIEPPLILHAAPDTYTDEVLRVLDGAPLSLPQAP